MAPVPGDRARRTWSARAILLAVGWLLLLAGRPADATPTAGPAGPVYVIEVTSEIDLGVAPYLDRVLDDAEDAGASAVIVRIDTPGGRLDAVLQMRDALLDSPLRTIALVDSTAFSAGALVAISCEEIYLTPGAVMGAATPVSGGTGEVADAKTISAVRATFESTAEQRGRDPLVAAAMVDTDVMIEGLVAQDQLLTLTVNQALERGYAEGVVDGLDDLLAELGLSGNDVVETSPSLAEDMVRFITNPVVASMLLIVGLLLFIGDLLSGGVGAGVIVGGLLVALFFWGHMLAGLAGWEDVALVVLGVALIGVEVFVLPGFGVAGVLGLISLAAGAFLSLIYRDFDFVTSDDLRRAAITVAVTFVAVVAGIIGSIGLLARRGPPRWLALGPRVDVGGSVIERAERGWLGWLGAGARLESDRRPRVGQDTGRTVAGTDDERSLAGAIGVAETDLRPSGIADIDGVRVDVVTSGEYVRRGEPIEVIVDERYRRVVRRRAPGR